MPATILRRLTRSDLRATVDAPQFAHLAAATLGNAASESDGFSEIYNRAALDFADDAGTSPSLDRELIDSSFTAGEFSGDTFSPVASDIAAFAQTGDGLIGDAGSATAQNPAAGGTPSAGGSPTAGASPNGFVQPHPGVQVAACSVGGVSICGGQAISDN